MGVSVQRKFDATIEGASALDDYIAEFGGANGVPEHVTFRSRICAAELAANAVEHGGARAGLDRFEISLALSGDGGLILVYADSSRPFDPTVPRASSSHLVTEAPGGRGLPLLQKLSKRTSYRRESDCNVVRMEFPDLAP